MLYIHLNDSANSTFLFLHLIIEFSCICDKSYNSRKPFSPLTRLLFVRARSNDLTRISWYNFQPRMKLFDTFMIKMLLKSASLLWLIFKEDSRIFFKIFKLIQIYFNFFIQITINYMCIKGIKITVLNALSLEIRVFY